ncbi:MAG: two-component regulator propeller domain-containing protein [Candidatus Neomarinimicrobiota bacterium]
MITRKIYLFLFIMEVLVSQSEIFLFENISVTDGLSESTVNVIMEDHNGFIYFGTDNGMDFYDGYSFRSYHTNSFNQNSIYGSKVNLIYEDSKNHIWVATDLGISKLNPYKNQFTRPLKVDHLSLDSFQSIEKIIELKNQKFIFKSAFNNSLYIFDELKDTTYCFSCENKKLLNDININELFLDQENYLWLATNKGMFYFKENHLDLIKYQKFEELNNANINTIQKGEGDDIWFGSDRGLGLLQGGLNGTALEYQNETDSMSLVSNYINDLDWDKKRKHLWISTSEGISLFNAEDNIFTNFTETPYANSIKENNVGEILIAEESGNLWFKTKNYPGINCLVRWYDKDIEGYESQFNHLENDIIDPKSLCDNNVSVFIEDKAGNIWIGTYENGLSFYSKNKSKFLSLSYDQENEWGLRDNKIYSITSLSFGNMMWIATDFGLENISSEGSRDYEYSKKTLGVNYIYDVENINDNILWVASDKGILRVNSDNDEIIRFSRSGKDLNHNQILDDIVYDIMISNSGDIWAGTASGLVILDTLELTSINSYSDMGIKVIQEDNKGNIWLGTDLDGLFILNKEQIKNIYDQTDFEADGFVFDQVYPNGISSSNITCFEEDINGFMWVGTDVGLNRYDKTDQSFDHFFVQDGLPSNFITSLEIDNKNNLWISTKNGISIFNLKDSTFVNYNYNDGIENIDFHKNSSDKSQDGLLYFGGPKGLTVINPEKLNLNKYQPNCVITKINKITYDDISYQDYIYVSNETNLFPELIIDHSIKSFTVEFVALNYHETASNKYRYKLQNLDKDWINSNDIRIATYNNLGRGSYKFEVQGSNNDNLWSKSSYLNIKFIPHPLLSNVAFFLYLIILLSSGYAFFRYRIQKQKKELEENRKSEELEKAREFQMSLIPQKAPEYPGYEFAFYMKTSTEVGGDYYDFFPQDDGSMYVVVGDATGHGLNAGMMVSITKAGLYASDFSEPNKTTSRLNQTIKSIDLGTTRMSLNMTRINGDSIEFTSAGMPPGYVFNKERSDSTELLVPGLPLGSMKNLKFKSSSFEMKKGDAFILISDGLPECSNHNGDMLDYQEVEKCVKENGDKNAQGIIDSLVNLGETWMNGLMNDDDITLVVIKKVD